MRATSLPTALPVAAAALALMAALMAAVLASLAVPSAALAERWLRPVPGEVARPFDYARATPFAAGAHRGADLAARPGARVRSACAGRVVHAGAVAGPELVVSVRCGSRRVSYLPLATVAVRAGAPVDAGTPLGNLAPGHGGLHLGVRRDGDPFGYEDPAALLRAPAPRNPPAARPAARRDPPARPTIAPKGVPIPAPRPHHPAPTRAPIPAPRPHHPASMPVFEAAPTQRTTPRPPPIPAPRPHHSASALVSEPATPQRIAAWPVAPPRPLAGPPPAALAPWPVWLGLAALLTGAVGSATIDVRRRAARRRAQAMPSTQAG